MTTSIERRNYLAVPADIHELAQKSAQGQKLVTHVGSTFLKCLTANTQAALGIEPRQRSVPRPPISDEERAEQNKAMKGVFQSFYESLLEGLPVDVKRDKKQLKSRVAFAHSARSELKTWLQAGHDVTTLAPAKVTKNFLREEKKAVLEKANGRAKRVKPEARLQQLAANLAAEAVRLSNSDKTAARRIVRTAMEQLGAILTDVGVRTVSDIRVATRERKLYENRGSMYFPLPQSPLTADSASANAKAA